MNEERQIFFRKFFKHFQLLESEVCRWTRRDGNVYLLKRHAADYYGRNACNFHDKKIQLKMWKYLRNKECLKGRNVINTPKSFSTYSKLSFQRASLQTPHTADNSFRASSNMHTDLTNICAFLMQHFKLHLMKNENSFSIIVRWNKNGEIQLCLFILPTSLYINLTQKISFCFGQLKELNKKASARALKMSVVSL